MVKAFQGQNQTRLMPKAWRLRAPWSGFSHFLRQDHPARLQGAGGEGRSPSRSRPTQSWEVCGVGPCPPFHPAFLGHSVTSGGPIPSTRSSLQCNGPAPGPMSSGPLSVAKAGCFSGRSSRRCISRTVATLGGGLHLSASSLCTHTVPAAPSPGPCVSCPLGLLCPLQSPRPASSPCPLGSSLDH